MKVLILLLLLSFSAQAQTKKYVATMYSLRGKTASGENVKHGVIAADWRILPKGTRVKIYHSGGSGIYVVKDTGKNIKGKRIDIWTPNTKNAVKFGRQEVKLEVLK